MREPRAAVEAIELAPGQTCRWDGRFRVTLAAGGAAGTLQAARCRRPGGLRCRDPSAGAGGAGHRPARPAVVLARRAARAGRTDLAPVRCRSGPFGYDGRGTMRLHALNGACGSAVHAGECCFKARPAYLSSGMRRGMPPLAPPAGSGDEAHTVNNFSKNLALWVIIGLLLIALFNLFQSPTSRGPQTSLAFSDFLSEVQGGRVSDVVIQGDQISGRFSDGRVVQHLCPERSRAGLAPDQRPAYGSPPCPSTTACRRCSACWSPGSRCCC